MDAAPVGCVQNLPLLKLAVAWEGQAAGGDELLPYSELLHWLLSFQSRLSADVDQRSTARLA